MAPREEDTSVALQEPLLSPEEEEDNLASTDSNANSTTTANNNTTNNNNNDDDSKNISFTIPSLWCCLRQPRRFSMNHNVLLNLMLCVLYGMSDSLWSGTVFAAYLKKLGHNSNTWVGNVEAANGLAGLFSALPVGYLADKLGRAIVLKWGGVLLVTTALLHAIVMTLIGVDEDTSHANKHAEIWLTIIMALWGIGGGIVMGPSQALFADSTSKGERSKYYTYLFMCYTVSSCMGPLVSIFLFQTLGDDWDLYDLRVIIYVGMAMESFNGLLMMFFDDSKALDEEQDEGEEENQESNDESGDCQEQGGANDEEQPTSTTEVTTTATTTTSPSTTNTIKYQRFIPYILFLHGLIFALGSGMTVKFFPLFFKDEVGMSPTQVQIVYFLVPLIMAGCSGVGQFVSKKGGLGRVPTALLFKVLGVSCLFGMVVFKKFLDARPLLLVPIYIMRTALMNSAYPLEESILMDFVPKQERARWKSLESISVFGWCGSAALGGWASDHAHGDYTFTFLITACIQTVGTLTWCLLLPIVPLHEEEEEASSNSNETAEDDNNDNNNTSSGNGELEEPLLPQQQSTAEAGEPSAE